MSSGYITFPINLFKFSPGDWWCGNLSEDARITLGHTLFSFHINVKYDIMWSIQAFRAQFSNIIKQINEAYLNILAEIVWEIITSHMSSNRFVYRGAFQFANSNLILNSAGICKWGEREIVKSLVRKTNPFLCDCLKSIQWKFGSGCKSTDLRKRLTSSNISYLVLSIAAGIRLLFINGSYIELHPPTFTNSTCTIDHLHPEHSLPLRLCYNDKFPYLQ